MKTAEDGTGRKYYRTASHATTEVLNWFPNSHTDPARDGNACTFLQCQHGECKRYNGQSAIFLRRRGDVSPIRKGTGLQPGEIGLNMRDSDRQSSFFLDPRCYGNGSGTPSALLHSRSRRRRRGDYFVSRDDASTTYPFVILSKLSPRYGDHARHGILHVSRSQGE
jgi:hypothetical protein